MRILLVTETLLREDNNVGNSYTNIFSGMNDIEIQNICCQQGVSDNCISNRCYQISEKMIVQNILWKDYPAGIVETQSIARGQQNKRVTTTKKIFDLARIFRFQIFFWIRDFIWFIGRWKNDDLDEFIKECNPDILFVQLQDRIYLNRVISYVKKKAKVPMVAYAWDDVYSLIQIKLSPLWWIDRFYQRKWIRKVANKSEMIYVISQEQKEEYSRTLKKRCELLYKGYEFGDFEPELNGKRLNTPLKIIYTGNLYGGRWQTISKLVEALKTINYNEVIAELYIYSATPLLRKHILKISDGRSSHFLGAVSAKEVNRIQEDADILLHVEAMNLRDSLTTRLSFSTKLVDYFKKQKCILAIGSKRCASIKYLEKQDAAIVISHKKQIYPIVNDLVKDESMLQGYRKKAWCCGVNKHQIKYIQKDVYDNLKEIISESSREL